jgi:RNA polymerase sigma-70 factor (ECF subfamily)
VNLVGDPCTPRSPAVVPADVRDEDLLSSWRQGSTEAGQVLFERHYDAVRRYFRNKVPAAAARDLVQETFLACLEACERFRRHSTFRTYLLGIAHHVMVDYLRATSRDRHKVEVGELILADLHLIGEDVIAAKRERRALLRALRSLRFSLQVVLELRYWESMSDLEIAKVLDEPLGTIKTRLRAGRRALEDQLAQRSGSDEELRTTVDSLHRWASRVRQVALPIAVRGEC